MEQGPALRVKKSPGVTGGTASSKSRSRTQSGAGAADLLDDAESMKEKLTQMTKRLRESERECTLLKSRLQRSESEGLKK
eukprot:SAG31_NODE_51_length_30464_cov_16.835628_26_plen_79_part_01